MDVKPITQEIAEALRKSGSLYHGEARLRLRLHRPIGTQHRSIIWEMTGPSGKHELAAEGTDLERLNAHWKAFASHERNQTPPDEAESLEHLAGTRVIPRDHVIRAGEADRQAFVQQPSEADGPSIGPRITAQRFTKADAERLAEDLTTYRAVKGHPLRFTAERIEQ